MYAFEALSCLLQTLNCKNFGKIIFFQQDIRKSKSKIAFLGKSESSTRNKNGLVKGL